MTPSSWPTPIPGERLLVRCEGGPSTSRLVTYPPPLEVPQRGGLCILNDDGAVHEWTYVFVPSSE